MDASESFMDIITRCSGIKYFFSSSVQSKNLELFLSQHKV